MRTQTAIWRGDEELIEPDTVGEAWPAEPGDRDWWIFRPDDTNWEMFCSVRDLEFQGSFDTMR